MTSSLIKGETAQLKCQLRASEKGYIVSIPSTEVSYDLVLDDGKSNLLKTQVKFCARRHSKSNSLELALYNTNSNRPHYTSQQIDLLLVYLPEVDKVLAYKEDIFHEKKTITINLTNKNSPHHFSHYVW